GRGLPRKEPRGRDGGGPRQALKPGEARETEADRWIGLLYCSRTASGEKARKKVRIRVPRASKEGGFRDPGFSTGRKRPLAGSWIGSRAFPHLPLPRVEISDPGAIWRVEFLGVNRSLVGRTREAKKARAFWSLRRAGREGFGSEGVPGRGRASLPSRRESTVPRCAHAERRDVQRSPPSGRGEGGGEGAMGRRSENMDGEGGVLSVGCGKAVRLWCTRANERDR